MKIHFRRVVFLGVAALLMAGCGEEERRRENEQELREAQQRELERLQESHRQLMEYQRGQDRILDSMRESERLKNEINRQTYERLSGKSPQTALGTHLIEVRSSNKIDFVDEQGLVFRIKKTVLCLHEGWPPQTEQVGLTPDRYKELEAAGQLEGYVCLEGAGPTEFSREIWVQQESMNKPENRPPGVPEVPVTGRYNYEMMQYGVACVEQHLRQLERAGFTELTRAKAALEDYRRRADLFRGRQLITDAEFAEVNTFERLVLGLLAQFGVDDAQGTQ